MKRRVLLALTSSCALAMAGDAVRPRASANDYPARQAAGDAMIAAVQATPAQLGKSFPAELAKHYFVIEVAIYPMNGASFDVKIPSFTLLAGSTGEIRPDTPDEVASLWRPRRDPPKAQSKVHVTNDTGVIYSTGRDPENWSRSGVGVYESTTVSTGPDPPG